MKFTLVLCSLVFSIVFGFAQNPVWNWAYRGGGTGYDMATAISTIGSTGYSFVTGQFSGTATFGSTTLISSGNSDIFVAWYYDDGTAAFAVKAGGTAADGGCGICTDGSGNSYVTGFFSGTASFGTYSLTSSGYRDIFVAKVDFFGNWLWAKRAGGPSSYSDTGYGIDVDTGGNAYVTGYFAGTATFGSTTLTSWGSSENIDAFVAKLDSSGNWLWAVKAGWQYGDLSYGIAVDGSGNSYITGQFDRQAWFGTIQLVSNWVDCDIFVAKLDTNGSWLWAKRAGTQYVSGGEQWDSDRGYGVAVDNGGNCYVTGSFSSTAGYPADFGTTNLTCSGTQDIFVAKLSTGGTWLWAVRAGGANVAASFPYYGDIGMGISADGSGYVFVTGDFMGAADFGSTVLSSAGATDVFVAELSPSGTWIWAQRGGGSSSYYTQEDWGTGVSTDTNGNVYLAGRFMGYADFGSTYLTSSGDRDMFVARLHYQVAAPLAPQNVYLTLSVFYHWWNETVHWDPVTTDTFGAPITPVYNVYYSGDDPFGAYTFLGQTSDNYYTNSYDISTGLRYPGRSYYLVKAALP